MLVTHLDGSRPPFVGLAHELIHARRNLLGISRADRYDDEAETVGLVRPPSPPPTLGAPPAGVTFLITENEIRAEHGIDLRVRYTLETEVIDHEWLHLARML